MSTSNVDVDLAVGSGAVAAPPVRDRVPRPAWSRLRRDRTALAGLVVVTLLVLAAIAAPWLAPHDPNKVDIVNKFASPGRSHLLGTDELGRDVFSRLLFGARVTLASTFAAATAICIVGLTIGTLAGYIGGAFDAGVSRVIDVLLSLPSFLLALAVTAILGPGLRNLLIAATLVWWAGFARVVRSAVIAEREKPYVESARAMGAPEWRLLGRHVLPNVIAPVVVLTTLEVGAVLLGLTGLSFLGLGVSDPTPEWGAMLNEARSYLSSAPHLMLGPGACIFLVVLGCNLLGDGLRDALDPRSARGR